MVCSEVTLQTYVPPRAEDTGLQSTVKTIFHMTNISRVGGKKNKKKTKHHSIVLPFLVHDILTKDFLDLKCEMLF